MSVERFVRRERAVRVGGLRLGPLRLGGGTYTVGPASALRFFTLKTAVAGMLGGEGSGTLREDFPRACLTRPVQEVRCLLGLLVREPPRERHMARLSPHAVLEVWDAWLACNDVDFLEGGDRERRGNAGSLPLEDLAFLLCAETKGAHTVRELLVERPYQEFLELASCSERCREFARTGTHPAEKEVTDADLQWFEEHGS